MTLLTSLREDLPGLMKRRDQVALRGVRDAISAIQHAETSYVVITPAAIADPNAFVAGGVRFGQSERTVTELSDEAMMMIARGAVTERLEASARYRELGDSDRALMLTAEASSLADRLDAYTG